MKRFNFNKPLVESPYPPTRIDVLWVDKNESTGEINWIKEFNNIGWNIILYNNVNPSDKPASKDKYLTFTAQEDNSSVGLAQIFSYHSLEYSTDQTTWNTFDTTTTVTLSKKGDKMYVRGILSAEQLNVYDCTKFTMTGKIAASGNCNAIWNYENLSAPLKPWCGCYLFSDCTSLTTAPELPATELAEECYESMFSGCTSLTTAPELPATTMSHGCYLKMFEGCTSLTTAPELHATTLCQSCYLKMFYGCTSLVNAPELPGTVLVGGECYSHMFENCTNLVTAPELPATIGTFACYSGMFKGCTSLKELTILLMSDDSGNAVEGMLDGVATNGTLYKHPDSTMQWLDVIPDTWTILDAKI